jgi:hypothetical protein
MQCNYSTVEQRCGESLKLILFMLVHSFLAIIPTLEAVYDGQCELCSSILDKNRAEFKFHSWWNLLQFASDVYGSQFKSLLERE